MRRWNSRGINDGHGNEKVHRSGGSIGNNTFPGHVFKGKGMAGQWGAERVTQLGLEIVEVRPEDNVILVRGSVPGPESRSAFWCASSSATQERMKQWLL